MTKDEKIKPGDVVRLKSGGPRMTVCKLNAETPDEPPTADCVWFCRDRAQHEELPLLALSKHEDPFRALHAALPVLEEAAETSAYGHYSGGDPRLFQPAADECTAEEIAAHKAACEAWERGERPDIRRACEPNREPVEYIDKNTQEKVTIPAGQGLALYAPFGVGVQTWRDEEAIKARDLVRAALEGQVE